MMIGYRTIVAAAIALLSEVLGLYGIKLELGEADVNAIVTVVGLLATIVFRVIATRRVRGGDLRG